MEDNDAIHENLIEAIEDNDINLVVYLIENKGYSHDYKYDMPVKVAVKYQRWEIAKYLIKFYEDEK